MAFQYPPDSWFISRDVTNAADDAQLKTALESAVDDVLAHAIAFTPTVVTLENVRVLGEPVVSPAAHHGRGRREEYRNLLGG